MYNIDNIKIHRDPYPYCFIENFLDKSIYESLMSNFPSNDWFGEGKYGAVRMCGKSLSHTNRFNLSAGQYCPTNFDMFIEKKENDAWKRLHQEVKKGEMRDQIISNFKSDLREYGYIESDFALPTFDISWQKGGYVTPPHLDTAYHVFQMIIYLDTSEIVSGGDITVWSGKNRLHKSYKVKDNSCFIWLNTYNSFHAAHPVLEGQRKFIYIGFDSVLPSAYINRPAPPRHAYNIKNAKSPWRIYDFNSDSYT